MESNGHGDAMTTRRLLRCGMLAGPLYLALGVGQRLVPDGFGFAARALARQDARWLARVSFLSGLIILLGFFGGMAVPNRSPVVGIWIAVVVGWVWLGVTSRYLARAGRAH